MIQLDFHFKSSEFSRLDTNMRKTNIRNIVNLENGKIIGLTDDSKKIIISFNKKFYLSNINEKTQFDLLEQKLDKETFIKTYYLNTKVKRNKISKFKKAPIIVERIGDLNIDNLLKTPFNSNTALGGFMCSKGGMLRGKHIVFIGGAGGGKTTLTMHEIAKIKECNPDLSIRFISAEMDRIELDEYSDKLPILKTIDVLCLPSYASETDSNGDFVKWDYWQLLEDFLSDGHDLILLDSIAALGEFISPQLEISQNKFVERYLALCNKHRNGSNNRNKYTTFWSIQQVTKNDVFVGSNALKHNTQAMFGVFRDSKTNKRYIIELKNRLGSVYGIEKMYFYIENKELKFDEEQLKRDIEAIEIQKSISINPNYDLSDLMEMNLNRFETIGEDLEVIEAEIE